MIQSFRHSFFQQLVLILIIVGLLCLLGDWWGVYELQVDEGLNLTKAVLVAKGHHLYHEIWSDQPPLLTYALTLVHQGFPFSLAAARTTILIFSLLLATSLFRVVLRFEGPFAAWSSILLLILSRLYLELSVSVMVGLPAIALAMLAIDIATPQKRKGPCSPVVSRHFVWWRPADEAVRHDHSARRHGGILVHREAGEPAPLARIDFTCGLVLRRASDRRRFHPGDDLGHVPLTSCFRRILPLEALRIMLTRAVFSCSTSLLSRMRGLPSISGAFSASLHFSGAPASELIIPAVWLVSGTILLSTHHPLWYHQTLILVPPLSWLGGVGFKNLFRSCEPLKLGRWMVRYVDRRIVFVAAVLLVVGIVALIRPIGKDMRRIRFYLKDNPDLFEQTARLDAAILTQGADLLITDRPILAYHAHLPVPPKLAVWSEKRMKAGRLTEKEILAEVAAHPGAPVLLTRFSYERSFLDRIASLREEVKSGFDQDREKVIHPFLPKTVRPAIEGDLFSRAPELLDGGIGGVFRGDGSSIERFARPASKEPLPPNSVVARPPGSAQELGACFAATARVTGSKSLLIHALEVGRALYCTQTKGGGWANQAVAAGNCGNYGFVRPPDKHATFDDGTMVSILYFAFDLSDLVAESGFSAPDWLEDMIGNALSFVVRTQSADGSWSQQYKAHGYHRLATLNDDAMTGLIRVLLVGYGRLGRPEYLAAAKRGGEFLLKAQDMGDEPAFAQQYSPLFKPASARKFEPAGYSSLETAYAINALD